MGKTKKRNVTQFDELRYVPLFPSERINEEALVASPTVGVAAVGHIDHRDDQAVVLNLVKHPVIADSDTVLIDLTLEFLDPVGARLFG